MIYYNLIYLTILGGYSYMCVCIYIYIYSNVCELIMVYLKIKMVEFLITLCIKLVLCTKFLLEWLFTTTKNTNDFHIKYLISNHFQVTIKWSINFFVSEYINFKIIFSPKRSWALIRKLWVHIDIFLNYYLYLSYV